jgi:hypothetical protein
VLEIAYLCDQLDSVKVEDSVMIYLKKVLVCGEGSRL